MVTEAPARDVVAYVVVRESPAHCRQASSIAEVRMGAMAAEVEPVTRSTAAAAAVVVVVVAVAATASDTVVAPYRLAMRSRTK